MVDRPAAATNGGLPAAEVATVFRRLAQHMPGRTPTAKGPKDQPDPFRSLVACLLSAQSRDANTAAATTALFALAATPEAMLELSEEEIASAIKPCGLYNTKAKNIRRLCRRLLDDLGGVVPQTRDGLMQLPGIGRKCADIVLSFTYGHDVIAVDTHVHRVANRLGLTEARTADETARQLEERAPPWALGDGHFWLIQFGKAVCVARQPKCATCFLSDLCRYFSTTVGAPGPGPEDRGGGGREAGTGAR